MSIPMAQAHIMWSTGKRVYVSRFPSKSVKNFRCDTGACWDYWKHVTPSHLVWLAFYLTRSESLDGNHVHDEFMKIKEYQDHFENAGLTPEGFTSYRSVML